ncbi:MAG: hypothetical protein O7H41_01985 [Planctomycetota bacterium]|nr:hypothetical protein [Planctomycetota bacterium]
MAWTDVTWRSPLIGIGAVILLGACGSSSVRDDVGRLPPYEVTDRSLFLEIDPERLGIRAWLRDRPAWESPPDFEPSISIWHDQKEITLPLRLAGSIEALKPGGVGESRIRIRFSEFPHPGAEGIVVELVVALAAKRNEFVIEVVPVFDPAGRLFGADFPPPLAIHSDEVGYTVLPTMQGLMIPDDYPESLSSSIDWWPDASPDPEEPWWGGAVFSRASSMAWFGAVKGNQAYLAIIDTPYDAVLDLSHPSGGPTKLRVRWRPSRGTLSYTRRVRYAFIEGANYMDLARRYREHAKSAGFHRSLKEKIGARPIVENLAGAVLLRAQFARAENPMIVSSAVESAIGKGIGRAVLRLPSGAGVLSKSVGRSWKEFTQELFEKGWILAAQAQPFGDLDHPESSDPEQAAWPSRHGSLGMLARSRVVVGSRPEERARRPQPDARRAVFTTWYGGYRRSREMVCPVRKAVWLDESLRATARRGIRISGVHLTDLSEVPLFDCYHAKHSLDKRGCAEAIRDVISKISGRGHVVYADEPTDYLMDVADLFDRCSYPRVDGSTGDPLGISVPLLSLVYHDAAIIAWDLDTGTDASDDAQYLDATLNGGMPALPLDADGWLVRRRPGESMLARKEREERLVKRAVSLAALHEQLWDEDLNSHEFVTPDGMIQRTGFSNGAQIEVNFGNGEIKLKGMN